MNVQGVATPYVPRSNTWTAVQNSETISKPEQTTENTNKGLTKAQKAAIGIGVLGAAAGAIYLAVSGKGKKALDAVKKYFNKNADNAKEVKEVAEDTLEKQKPTRIFQQGVGENKKIVENVKLENGRAVLEDGSGFTGVMKTVNKKGDCVAIQYDQGDMYRSFVDGSIFKEYDTTYNLKEIVVDGQTKAVPVKDYTRIDTFKDNIPMRRAIHYYEDGKLVQSGKKTLFHYDENGKFISMEKLK